MNRSIPYPAPAQVGETHQPLSWRGAELLEAALPSLDKGPVVVSSLLDGKVVASSSLVLPGSGQSEQAGLVVHPAVQVVGE